MTKYSKNILIIILITLAVGIGYVFFTLDSNNEVIQDTAVDKTKEVLNIPRGWWFPAGEAPTSYLIFRDDGFLEYPVWFSTGENPDEYVELVYEYNVDSEIVTIKFESHPELYPSNPELFFRKDDLRPAQAKLVAYDPEMFEVQLKITTETRFIIVSGIYFFYRVE
ncbi:MAG: hypothetical protein Q8P37_00395 [Candidatus Spechtbacteria bacterium]|nr:hypothetical protein [Candidatus Spechtbacteria bacterium]